jgi:membrane protease YdiL (CAAX protease family)
MPDPTESVIIATFGAALGIFVISSVIQKLTAGPLPDDGLPEHALDEFASGDSSPYEPPHCAGPPPLPQVGKVATWFYRPFDLLGLGFVFVMFFSLAVASARSTGKEDLVLDPAGLLTSIAFQFITAGIVTFFVIGRIRPVDWLGLRWPSWPWVFLIAPAAVFSMWMMIGGLQVAGLMNWIESLGVETVQDTVKLLQDSNDPLILGLMAFAAVVAAPLCEEIVFRGYLYPVAKKFAGPWAAALCSALVFGAAHGSLAALLPLLVFGVLLVFLYEKTGSIWAPVAVHCCFNGATVITQIVARYYNLPLEITP